MRRRPAALALTAGVVVWFWQALTVHFNYGGNWTALFLIGDRPLPPLVAQEPLYIFANSRGYDGALYHIVAHDPWMRGGGPAAMGGAALRYPRILVPALAWILALGQDAWVHWAYFTVILFFTCLGVYWLSALLDRWGWNAAWGLAFALTPAAIISLDRMTVDVSLAALCVGFALYSEEGSQAKLLPVLAGAALVRETGYLLIGSYALFQASRRDVRGFLCAVGAAMPAIAWGTFVAARLGPSPAPRYLGFVPLAGFFERWAHPAVYALPPMRSLLGQVFDCVALLGIGLMLASAFLIARARRWTPSAAGVYALAVATIFLENRSVWEDVFAFARVLTPAALLTAIEAIRGRKLWWALAPTLLLDARISLYFPKQVIGVARGILGI